MKFFVWDFHGVLEKDNEKAVVEITNIVLSQFGYEERLNLDDCHRFYGLRWFQYFEQLLPNKEHEEHLRLTKICVEKENKSKHRVIKKYIKANDHVFEVLNQIIKAGHINILISNTDKDSLKLFLEDIGLDKYFTKGNTFAADNHKGKKQKSKKEILRKYLKGKNFEKVVVIGDSPDDIELASVDKNSVSYLYTHPCKKFRECQSDYKINDLREVIKEL